MKRILTSFVMIAAVAAMVAGATGAFFSDTETSTGNTFTAGTIDISVDDQNPWDTSWSNYLDKPCQTNYMNFVIKNEGENPARIWKRLTNVVNGPGAAIYPDANNGPASSEPEFVDGGGVFVNGVADASNYVERDNLSAFMIYDMAICVVGRDNATCELEGGDQENPNNSGYPKDGTGWIVLIDEDSQVRVDNVVDTWIEIIDALEPTEKLWVSQSYHLMTWDDSGQPMVTNWAQGDTMEFDVELEARQLSAPAPGTELVGGVESATVQFIKKDSTTWDEIGDPLGSLTYAVEGPAFAYDFNVSGLAENEDYSLIYYADPYPGNHPGVLIQNFTADGSGNYNSGSQSIDLSLDLPDSADANYPVGAKLWIVLADDYSGTGMTAWNPTEYLFDKGLVNYDDTQVN